MLPCQVLLMANVSEIKVFFLSSRVRRIGLAKLKAKLCRPNRPTATATEQAQACRLQASADVNKHRCGKCFLN